MNRKEMFNRCLIPTIFLKNPSENPKLKPRKQRTTKEKRTDNITQSKRQHNNSTSGNPNKKRRMQPEDKQEIPRSHEESNVNLNNTTTEVPTASTMQPTTTARKIIKARRRLNNNNNAEAKNLRMTIHDNMQETIYMQDWESILSAENNRKAKRKRKLRKKKLTNNNILKIPDILITPPTDEQPDNTRECPSDSESEYIGNNVEQKGEKCGREQPLLCKPMKQALLQQFLTRKPTKSPPKITLTLHEPKSKPQRSKSHNKKSAKTPPLRDNALITQFFSRSRTPPPTFPQDSPLNLKDNPPDSQDPIKPEPDPGLLTVEVLTKPEANNLKRTA